MATASADLWSMFRLERPHNGKSWDDRTASARLGPSGQAQVLARTLGWLSIALGLTELVAAQPLGRLVGISRPWTLRAAGLRELTSGIGILTRPRRTAWLWSRVVGDAMDLALLGSTLRARAASRGRVIAAIGAVSAVTALDVFCSRELSRQEGATAAREVHLHASVAVERPPDELYRFWRGLNNLPRFMHHLHEVRDLGEQRSHWMASGPLGSRLEWDAKITEDRPEEFLSWRSLPGSKLQTDGSVSFEPAPNGTGGSLVRVHMCFVAPGGPLASGVAPLLTTLSQQQLKVELRRFKQLIETGEVATTQGQPSGRRSTLVKAIHGAVQS